MSDIYLFTILSFVAIAISLIAIFFIKKFIPLHIRYNDNAVIGTTASLISVIYGVLAGLSALYLINNNSYTADAVQREANAVADIYRDSQWLNGNLQKTIQEDIKNYLNHVITIEWPLMKKGLDIDDQGDQYIDKITYQLIHLNKSSGPESLLLHDMLDEVRSLYNARQQRIHMSYSELNPELWVVILIGTFLTLFINFLFGMNFYLHIIIVCAASLMTSSLIFLLITLDRPFQGEFSIQPDAFRAVLKQVQKNLDKLATETLTKQSIYTYYQNLTPPHV